MPQPTSRTYPENVITFISLKSTYDHARYLWRMYKCSPETIQKNYKVSGRTAERWVERFKEEDKGK